MKYQGAGVRKKWAYNFAAREQKPFLAFLKERSRGEREMAKKGEFLTIQSAKIMYANLII